MFSKMKKYNMHVKTIIANKHNKILLLKEKRADKKIRWDLPGARFTEDQSFDETVITNVQKVIGYYVYPGKIIGITSYSTRETKDVYVIMEGMILNGELLLSKEYENYAWVDVGRMPDYPLAPWIKNYLKETKHPFRDVEEAIEENDSNGFKRRDTIQHDFRSNISRSASKHAKKSRTSFGLLKDTIKRTFRPRSADVNETTPKDNEMYENTFTSEENPKEDIIIDQNNTNKDIIIEHDTPKEDIIIDQNDFNKDIIIESDNIESDTAASTNKSKEKITKKVKKVFDMNINKESNMKKVKPPVKTEEPEIKIIHKDEEPPLIRKEKESTERISFSSDRGKRPGWRERLDQMNRTDANNQKKHAPKPRGRRR